MSGGIVSVDSSGEIGDGVPVADEGGALGHAVDAEGCSGDEGESSVGEARGEFNGDVFPVPLRAPLHKGIAVPTVVSDESKSRLLTVRPTVFTDRPAGVEPDCKPGCHVLRSTTGTCATRRTDRIRMAAATSDAIAPMAHAAIETARPGLFVIRYSNATTWDVPKKTE